jgi:hypothetical protein
VKLDLTAGTVTAFEGARRYAVQMLVDKVNAQERLTVGWEPSDEELARQIDLSLRMTYQGASWPVRLLRRQQWATQAYSELTLIHNVLIPLMLLQHDRRAFHRNAMTRERLLTPEQRREIDAVASETLAALVERSLARAYRAHMRLLDVLRQVARDACRTYGVVYPEAAEREAIRFFEREWPR